MRKRARPLFIGILLTLLLVPAPRVLAYSVKTHAFLTDVVFDFYNQYASDNKLPEELRDFLIDGSRREDTVPRQVHHFYDPVYNRGLTVGVEWQKAKEWVHDTDNQNTARYSIPETIASILTAAQEGNIEAITAKSSYTWNEAIRYWLEGENEKAMFTLGHVIHLIEDMAVPEHTRNDEHLTDGSVYEDWTEKFNPQNPDLALKSRLGDRKPVILEDLGTVFDQLATFSNGNFYSEDTIGADGGYKSPFPEPYTKKINGVDFAFQERSVDGDEHLLFMIKNYEGGDIFSLPRSSISFSDPLRLVMKDYWSLLSTKAVQYSAGVIDLFFRDVARAEEDPSFLGEESKSTFASAIDAVQSFFTSAAGAVQSVASDVATFAQNVISKIQNEPESVEEIVAESVERIEQLLAGDPTDGVVIDTEEERAQLKELQNQLDDISDQLDDLTYQVDVATGEDGKGGVQEETDNTDGRTDGTDTDDETDRTDRTNTSNSTNVGSSGGGGGVAASAPNLAITEIMYNASGTDDGREWIEIRNNGASAASLNDVRFLEGDTNHRLAFVSGSESLAPGSYAVVADDPEQFLIDYPTFSGNLFDSTFSLLNDGETLALTFNGNTFHSVSYSSSTGAYGDGNSLQLVGLAWGAASPTPGAVNVAASSSGGGSSEEDSSATSTATSSPPTSGFGSYHVLISEVQVEGADAGDEFIELYNPTDAAVDISGWSLQYAGAGAEITSSTIKDDKKNFLSTSSIAAKGFYLIGRSLDEFGGDGYDGNIAADMTHRTFSLSGNPTGARIFLVVGHDPIESETDARILDAFDYASSTPPVAGGSFERRAWSNNLCHSVIPGGTGEFLGNGCDTGVFADDFELRTPSNPQNSASLIEPRAAPSALQAPTGTAALAEYVRDSVSINFVWQDSSDFQGSTSTITYRILNASTSAALFNGTSTSFTKSLTEVGRLYSYVLQAFDRDGLGSATSSITVEAPSFVSRAHLYPDPFATSSRYVVDLYYDSYPFIPHRWSSGDTSRVAVFYLNREPSTERDFTTHSISGPVTTPAAMQEGLLAMKFRDCGGQPDQISQLPILPDSSDNCAATGPYNDDVEFSLLEDPHLRFTLASSSDALPLTELDYFTVAFYDYSSPTWACSCRMFSLVATDATQYHFTSTAPDFAAPELLDSVTTEFDGTSSRLIVRWATSTDVDTLDDLITYEIAFSTSSASDESEWQSAGAQPHADLDDQTFISHRYLRHVVPGESFTIGVRAADEFGVTSTARTTVWQYQSASGTFLQSTSTGWSFPWGEKTTGPCPTCPVRASLQSVMVTSSLTFDVAAVRLWQEGSGSPSTLRLGVFADDGANKPLLTNKLGEATLDQLGFIATSTDLAFTFSSPITLDEGTKYWFGMDVTASGWNGTSGLFGTRWRNAIATGDEYGMGEAGIGAVEECANNDYCGTTIPSPSADADWYFKLYLRE